MSITVIPRNKTAESKNPLEGVEIPKPTGNGTSEESYHYKRNLELYKGFGAKI